MVDPRRLGGVLLDGGSGHLGVDALDVKETQLRAALFEPFRQGPEAPPHAPGVGIGLTLVARFAELHGGRAWVEERPGGGSSFRVLLPDPPATPPPQCQDGGASPNIAFEPLDFQEPAGGTNTNAC